MYCGEIFLCMSTCVTVWVLLPKKEVIWQEMEELTIHTCVCVCVCVCMRTPLLDVGQGSTSCLDCFTPQVKNPRTD
jgi:hypothetical protein